MVDDNIFRHNSERILESLHNTFNTKVPRRMEARLRAKLAEFREDLQAHPSVIGQDHFDFSHRRRMAQRIRRIVRPIAAACIGAAVIGLLLSLIPGHGNPSWANVLKQFGRSKFLTASVYIRNQPFAEPEMVEYWCGSDNKLRILSRHFLTFASEGASRTFNLATRQQSEADGPTKFILNLYGYEHSLIPMASYVKTLYLALYEGKALESTYQINASPEISEDLLVYDLKHKISGLFLRVWVLRTSMLPVRLHYWNDYGSRTDVLFSYSKEQPNGFFDPDQFESVMNQGADKISTARLMYFGLKDAGDKVIPAPGI